MYTGSSTWEHGGGGGGGYYGGGGGTPWNAGGGGSSYIAGVTNGTTTSGVQYGNGFVIISYNIQNTAGCTDSLACNYDPTATCDDGSCLTIYGCTDSLACNYVDTATCDDGSCLTIYGCTDSLACNYDPTALCDDGSCAYPNSSMDSITVCDAYPWNGILLTNSGTYDTILTNVVGCDSIVYINLIVNEATSSDSTLVINNFPSSASVPWNGLTITSSGSYPVTFPNSNSVGCDSTATLHLTLNPATGILDINKTEKTLLKVTDVLGRETKGNKNEPLFYIYDDGTVEKRIIIE